jgi:parvulin-like peptidyl-prolyl isomerase
VLESIQKQLIVQQYVKSFESKVVVDEAALLADYDKFKAEGRLDNTDVAHILVRSEGDPESDAAALQKVQEARKRIVEGGESFGAVASEVTDDPGSKERGGAYPGTPKGQMVPEFDAAMESTAIGEVSEPFKTDFGWHILTVTARNVVPIDDLRPSFTQKAVMEAVQAEVAKAREGMQIETLIDLPPLSEEDAALLKSMRGDADPEAPADESAPVDESAPADAAAVEEAVAVDADEAAAQ